MNAPTLLGPSARPLVALGGANAWRQRTIRGVICSFQWLDLTEDGLEATTPCMCLFRPQAAERGAYVIPQVNAYQFANRQGGHTAHLATSAFAIAETLGFDIRDRSAIRLCMDIILEGLPDLVDMPSEPPASSDAIVKSFLHGIEATARVNGRKVHEELL